jgi:cell fate (sporulation/competence/biofilm development) regulator YlbF (YheA/YmcA/DUF963 family)
MKKLPPELKQAVQTLNAALKQSPPLRAYADALAKMEADPSATGLLDELQRVQADLRVRQSNGGVTLADTARLRQLQADVQTHPTIAGFLAADREAKAYLPQVNQLISDLIGIDFASLGRTKGCC